MSAEPRVASYSVNGMRVHALEEISIPVPIDVLLPDINKDAAAAALSTIGADQYDATSGNAAVSIKCWLAEAPDGPTLIDSAVGNAKSRPLFPPFDQLATSFLSAFDRIGVRPDAVKNVVVTHLHGDHVGWNTELRDGKWTPVFKNATYVFPEIEVKHWQKIGHTEDAGINRGVFADSVQPVFDAGQAVSAAAPHQISTSAKLVAAPGHTIGHSMVVFNEGPNEVIFCADVLHHPLQIFFPKLNSAFCEIPEQARQTRRAVLERAAERGSTLFPVHFGAPHCFTVRASGSGFVPTFVRPL